MRDFLRYLFVVAAMLMVVVGDVWGENLQYTWVERFNGTTTFDNDDLQKITNGEYTNNVKFSIQNVSYYYDDNLLSSDVYRLDYPTYKDENQHDSKWSWEVKTDNNNPFSLVVTDIKCQVRGRNNDANEAANAWFNNNSKVDCKTKYDGENGSQEVGISDANGLGTSVMLHTQGYYKKSSISNWVEDYVTFTLHNIRYTYKVTQRMPLFQYKAVAVAEPNTGGDVYASWVEGSFSASEAVATSYDAQIYDVSTGMTKTAYFKAVEKEGYNFVGWKRNLSDDSYVSTSAIYSESLTSRTNDADAPATITMYAVFMAKNQPLFSGSNISGVKVGESVPTSFVFEHVGDNLPSANESDDFYYVINHSPDASSKADSPNPNLVISYNPSTNQIVGLNSGTATITFIHKENENFYYASSPAYLVTVSKHPTSFELNTFSSCYTGDEFEVASLFSATTNNPEVALEYISGDESILKVEDGKLKAVCAGTTTFTVRQQENYKWLGHSQTLTITVNKYNSNFNLLQTQYTRKIGEVITEAQLYTRSNTEIPPTVVSDNPAVVSFNASTRQLEANAAGQAIITISQPEDCKWTHYNATCTVTVQKHTPVFTWNDPVYFNQALIEDYFATSNKDTKISITNQTDREVADLYFSTSDPSDLQTLDLTTYNKGASTKVTVSQEENWYWYAKSEEHTITPIDPNNHVPFVMNTSSRRIALFYDKEDDNGEITCSDNGEIRLNQNSAIVWTANPLYYTIKFTGIPDKLSFDYKQTATSTAIGDTEKAFIVYESSDGSSWNEIWTSNGMPGNTDYESKSNIQLNPGTRYLKFFFDATYSGYYRNITVTEREEFHAVDNSDSEVEHLYFDANQVFTDKTLSFNLKYANAGYKVKVESNDSRFTVNPTSINTIGGCKYGKENISVTYRSTTPYETTDNSYIVISDELAELNGHRDTVYLHASSYKPTQQLEWRADFKAVEKPIIRVKEGQITDAATAKSGLPVTYTSSNTDVIAVSDDGRILIPLAAGEVTITATQVGNETWLSVSDTKTFIVTDKTVQYIGWGDDLTGLVLGDADMTLTAKVYLRDEETQAYIYSEERTNLLQYSVGDVNVVTVSGNVLSIKGVGQTTATVTAPGDEDYAEATLTVPVRVRKASAGCEDVLLLNHPDEVGFFAYNTNEIVQGPFGIDKEKGVPGSLSFQHRGASWDLGIQYYGGKIKAQYVTDDNSTWTDAIEVTPIEDQATFESEIYLPRNATQIRFVRPSGAVGYHYVSNIQVHPAQYLEAPVEIDFGEIHVGSIEDTTFVVNYANIKDDVYLTASSGTVTTNPTSFGEQCGEFGTKTITVQWIPSEVNANAHETVTLTDGVSGTTCVVNLIANVTPGTQNLYWQDRPMAISNCGDIEFPEQTTAHIDIIWEVIKGKDVADFNKEGELVLYKQGEITVRGYNDGNANYHPFAITYTFIINYDPVFMGTVDTDWNKIDNWNICRLPNENDIVTIKALVELVTHEKVRGMQFAENGKMHITPNAGMTIGSYGLELTTNRLITIDNTPDGAGFLKVDPSATNKPSANVTINYTTAAYNSGNPRDEIWQYMGAPGTGMDIVADEDKTLIYQWSEVKGWEKQTNEELTPFAGYVFTQNKDKTKASFEITATPIIADKTIDLTCTPNGMRGGNVFANSYLAPIDVAKIDPANDLVDVEGTIYLFNSGSWNQWQDEGGKDHMNYGVSPGQYYALSPKGATLMDAKYDQTTIPPMQGVYVVALSNNAQIKLDYAKHVYGVEASNRPMRAPEMRDENFKRVRLQVNSQNSGADRMYVIQHEDATKGYDYGYDAKNIAAEDQVNIYTTEQGGEMEISVSNRIDSTYIGFQAGSDSEYRLRITSVVGEKLLLKDLETETVVAVENEVEYTFSATPKSVNNKRFLLIDQLAGEEIDDLVKVYIYDNVVHVLEAPKDSDMAVYSVGGLLMARYEVGETPCMVELSGLPTGIYLVRVADKVVKFVCK